MGKVQNRGHILTEKINPKRIYRYFNYRTNHQVN
jgi:hypothetical protein